MAFCSIIFLFRFLPIFLALYYIAFLGQGAGRMRSCILFAGSLFFYAWGSLIYVPLLLLSVILNYVHGRLIGHFRKSRAAAFFLFTSVLMNLAVLLFFKYAGFALRCVNSLAGTNLPAMDLPLPVGISFYTLQALSYAADIYRGKIKAQKNLLDFAAFFTMFPFLTAGPLVRYADVEDSLCARRLRAQDVNEGVRRFIVGLSKKVLLADNLWPLFREALAVEPKSLNVMLAWEGIAAFGFWIYFYFSGFSDMAVGLGRMLGFRFPENFRYPYTAACVTEFWHRWFVTLGSWFNDYVYLPLSGKSKKLAGQLPGILIVWMLIGMWHGAGWNFLLWGLWFAFFLMLEKILSGSFLARLPKLFGFLYTGFVVILGWTFFALEDINSALWYLQAMFGGNGAGLYDGNALYLLKEYGVLLLAAGAACLPLWKKMADRLLGSGHGVAITLRRPLEMLLPALLLLASIAYIVDAPYNPLPYFGL